MGRHAGGPPLPRTRPIGDARRQLGSQACDRLLRRPAGERLLRQHVDDADAPATVYGQHRQARYRGWDFLGDRGWAQLPQHGRGGAGWQSLLQRRQCLPDDGDFRLTYQQFFDRCDRWSTALQRMDVRQGDRVAYIAPNVHQQLESFYAVPQIGAVLVPVNYRLTADDFAYIIDHSGATVVCATEDYLDSVDGIRDRIGDVKQFVA